MSSGSTEVLGEIVVVRDVSITSFDEKLQHQSTFLEPKRVNEKTYTSSSADWAKIART